MIKDNLNLMYLTMILLLAFILNATVEAAPYKIAVIDTGFTAIAWDTAGLKLCKKGHYDFDAKKAQVGSDKHGHGSYVLSIINNRAQTDDICFLVYKVFGPGTRLIDVDTAMLKAARNGARVINMSLSISVHSDRTKKVIKSLTRRGIKIFVAAGNARKNLNLRCNTYPGCYKGLGKSFIRVGALDEDGDVAKYSNYGMKVAVYKYGRTITGSRGTSFASPRAAGDYVKSLNLDKE